MCVQGGKGTADEVIYICLGDKETRESFIGQVLLELSQWVLPNTYFCASLKLHLPPEPGPSSHQLVFNS